MKNDKVFVNYGCGTTAPDGWLNFDASPTLKIQKIPFIGSWLTKLIQNVIFPKNVFIGDIIKGLPIENDSCDGVYCSHILEHLSYEDCMVAIKNTYAILKPNGVFRCVLPDLEAIAKEYIANLNNGKTDANVIFFEQSLLGKKKRRRGLIGLLVNFFGNSNHLWMWDFLSLKSELAKAGFKSIRRCSFNDSSEVSFLTVEEESRFSGALAIECIK